MHVPRDHCPPRSYSNDIHPLALDGKHGFEQSTHLLNYLYPPLYRCEHDAVQDTRPVFSTITETHH
ncbi:hypothetical protein SAMN05421858_4654 [Haladaptatus litoreus]|uniref:Uncharacterized protein n=1 Tax=Haladaptatus litoreus TaxID=553468 RepID=A0A1N7EZ54_9EURY|nr:hypothetical protein SAMN05421858_4654 [Haladaptatus litoreus]